MKSDVAEPLLYDDEDDVGIQPRPSVSSSHCYGLFQRGVTIVTMGLAFLCIISLSAVILHLESRLNQIRYESDLVPSTSKAFLPNTCSSKTKAATADPIAREIQYSTEWTSPDDWNNDLLWGEPTNEADIAWNHVLGSKSILPRPSAST